MAQFWLQGVSFLWPKSILSEIEHIQIKIEITAEIVCVKRK